MAVEGKDCEDEPHPVIAYEALTDYNVTNMLVISMKSFAYTHTHGLLGNGCSFYLFLCHRQIRIWKEQNREV